METPELREAYDAARLRVERAEAAMVEAAQELDVARYQLNKARSAFYDANTPRPHRITLP